ncbi:hypothetical protein Tco_0482071, partial [Tanacetum coccineum]
MVNARHKEVLKASTSKGAELSASDAKHDDRDNGSSTSSEDLNFRGFTDEETKILRSMIRKQVGKTIKNVMPYYLAVMEGAFRTSNCKKKNKINFASNFLRDNAKMWWEGKVCDKGEEWIGSYMEDDVDISALTIEQYISLIPGTDDEDAYEDVRTVHIFYIGLDISTQNILDSNGFIPLMTPTQALELIQVMEDHSHNWYDETTTRERINDVLDNVDATHKSFKGEHLTKEYPLKKENATFKHNKDMESLEETIIKFCEGTIKKQIANDEKMRKILENTESNIRALKTRTKNLLKKAYQLTHKILTNTGAKVKAIMTMGKENIKESVPYDLPPTPFLGHFKEQI